MLEYTDGTSSEASSPPSSPKISGLTPSGGGKNAILGPKKRQRKPSASAMYTAAGGIALPRDILANVTQFQRKQRKGMANML